MTMQNRGSTCRHAKRCRRMSLSTSPCSLFYDIHDTHGIHGLSRIHRNGIIRQLAEHFRRIHRLDARRRQFETPGIVQANGVLDYPASLGNEAIVGMEGIETALLEGWPDEAAFDFAGRQDLRILGEPAAKNRGAA